MPYARRVANLSPEGAYAVLAHAHALEAEGRRIIHLEIGQPDFETFPHFKQEGIQAFQDEYTRPRTGKSIIGGNWHCGPSGNRFWGEWGGLPQAVLCDRPRGHLPCD